MNAFIPKNYNEKSYFLLVFESLSTYFGDACVNVNTFECFKGHAQLTLSPSGLVGLGHGLGLRYVKNVLSVYNSVGLVVT